MLQKQNPSHILEDSLVLTEFHTQDLCLEILLIHDYFGNRLKLNLKPSIDKEALVSREKVSQFKEFMGK